jgi:folate-binding protein YgfZ
VPSEENPEIKVTDSMSFYDPRLRSLGCRIICPIDSLEVETETINLKLTGEDYNAIRMLYGVLEGPHETKDQFPLNLNFQHLNGISFNKGCYIGQELTQRTHHTGVIRKVAMPFICTEKLIFKIGDENDNKFQGHVIIPFQSLDKKFSQDLKGKNIIDSNGNIVGTVMISKYNCGIAMIEKEKLESTSVSKFTLDGLNTIIYDPISLWESVREVEEKN